MQNKSDSPNLTVAQNPRVKKSGDYRKTARISVGVTASEKRFSDFVRDALLHAAARVENEDDGP